MNTKRTIFKALMFGALAISVGAGFAGCESGAAIGGEPAVKMAPQNNSAEKHDAMPQGQAQMEADASGKDEVVVTIENFVFSPANLTISPGTKVTWINKDEAPHTATSTDKPGKFDSGGMDTGDKFSFVFKEAGDYPYFCALHPQMKANVRVK